MRAQVTDYVIHPPEGAVWPQMTVALVADPHLCTPYMTLAHLEGLVAQTNALAADLILLLGDYAGHVLFGRGVAPALVAARLSELTAPLGVWSVMGNHDWRDDPEAQLSGRPSRWHLAFEAAGLAVLSNQVVRIETGQGAFQLAGLESQRARQKFWRRQPEGYDNWPAVAAQLAPEPFTLLMAHEPDIFPHLPDHVGLTVSGHTHGGQIAPFGVPLVVPSIYGRRYAYGHLREGRKQLVVSGGLGYSGLPLRYRRPPELVRVRIT